MFLLYRGENDNKVISGAFLSHILIEESASEKADPGMTTGTLTIMLPMENGSGRPGMDSVLLAFLETDSSSRDQELETLMSVHIKPVAQRVIRFRLSMFYGGRHGSVLERDREDILGNVMLQLLVRLQDLRQNSERKAILSFQAYVKVLAHHACDLYFRNRYPERSRLKNRLKYLLTHNPSFALWKSSRGKLLCGLEPWSQNESHGAQSQVESILENSRIRDLSTLLTEDRGWKQLATAVNTIFQQSGVPLELNQLVRVIADLSGIASRQRPEENSSHLLELIAHSKDNTEEQFQLQSYLKSLWTEILELPIQQRVALLFSLRDTHGKSLLFLFPALNVASIRSISEAVEISANELAQMWNLFPLEDKAIAERLGVARQQVINFRKSARKRLSRRTRNAWPGRRGRSDLKG